MLLPSCTRLMLSSPPAAMTDASPAMMRCAASAIACRPELQKRFTVMPETVTGKTGADRRLPRDVAAGGALRQRAAENDVLDFAGLDAGALDRVLDHMAAEFGAVRHVEGAAIGFADRRAGGGNDDGVGHLAISLRRGGLFGAHTLLRTGKALSGLQSLPEDGLPGQARNVRSSASPLSCGSAGEARLFGLSSA